MSVLHTLDLVGVVVFAISGVLEAGRRQMDIFGAVVLALVTALGGGTLRDVILQHGPVFWVADPTYVIAVTLAALAAFVVVRRVPLPRRFLLVADAAGLAVFAVMGTQKALGAGAAPVVALGMGVITGVAGGVIRDVLCNEVPLVLRREIYATAALSGGLLFWLLREAGTGEAWATALGALCVFAVRLVAVRLNLDLPTAPPSPD